MGDPYSHSQSHSNPSELRFHTSNVEATDHNSDAGAGVCAYSGAGSNSARYKLMSPAKLPITRSTSITIPSGLSPTSFLESPVLLSNIKAEPSPTTGSFFKPHLMHGFGGSAAFLLSRNSSNSNPFDEQKSNGFEFRPHTGSNSVSGLSSAGPLDQCQFRPFVPLPLSNSEMLASKEFSNCASVSMTASRVNMPVDVDSDDMNQGEHSNGNQAPQSDHKDTVPSVMTDKSSDDGYNWRKYGQKVVKGCEFPRSYYKCTHPNCEVKKIFERSRDGQIIDTVYKGVHDHPKPQPNRRFTAGALMSIQEEKTVKASSLPNQGDDYTAYTQTTTVDPNGTPLSSPRGANGDNADGASPVLNGTNDDVDEDDPFSKRRKTDVGGSIDLITAVVKPIREPRVVVQTLSEVDILDDGYRWRKYGQKVVRGNPNPRSYYKCTNAGCSVRKHVERAAHDPKAVITTYEGKHNHDVPMARTNSHEVGGPMPVVNGMSRIIRSEDNDTISLDLGVGMTYGAENNNAGYEQHHQTLESEPVRSQVHDIINSNHKVIQASPIPTYYGVVNGGMNNLYGSRENRVESRNFEAPPLGHSSG